MDVKRLLKIGYTLLFIYVLFFTSYIKVNINEKQLIEDSIKETPKLEENKDIDKKIVYLTFDDGPSENTIKIIDILNRYNIKATFFLVGYNIINNNNYILKRLYNENHYIGLHTISHDYYYLYKHKNAHINFINEILEQQKLIYQITGFKSKLIRPPYSDGTVLTDLHIQKIIEYDFKYWDWNVDTEDWKALTIDDIFNSITHSLQLLDNHDKIVVLFHELNISVKSLPFVINYFIDKGYQFKTYDPDKHFPINFKNLNF